jgi:hypothetical protein
MWSGLVGAVAMFVGCFAATEFLLKEYPALAKQAGNTLP